MIEDILRQEGKHNQVMTSCFKQFSNFPTNWLFSAQNVHNLLLREITVDGARENELFVSLGGKKVRFGQREFCMVTVLWFGELSDIINTPYVGNANGIQERYWPGEEGHELKLSTVWAMEAIETLIDGFGLRLEHTLPRMRRWTMHKRPRNFVKTISDLEANIRSGKAQVLEVLEATDDEAQKDYMVGVDFDMSVGPQFKPPLEMEMKENNESLDDLDDGNDGDDGDDGGDRAPTRKTAVKQKAPKKKKKTSVKKQRKSIPITSLDEEDPLHKIPPPISSRQEPRSRGGDKITELLEAVKALPDEMERIVKREAPLTDVTDQSLHVKKVGTSAAKELPPTATKDVAPTVKKEVAGLVLVSGDMGRKYEAFKRKTKPVRQNMGTEESVDQSFFLELEEPNNWFSTDHIDAYMSLSKPKNFRHSLVLMSSEFYTKLNVEWKRIIEADKEAESSFDVLGFEFVDSVLCWGTRWALDFMQGAKYHEEYAETAIMKSADWNWGQKDMLKFQKEIAFDIYNNSVTFNGKMG
ncbi:hypothetical protein EZV62_027585 [Acer yangbiense]|uniref:DUF1985 domain-containing protein n=1 Tax=Acer yangbiense TaxID=1000413 RepID=A0A5C7GU61_9ROSI|nr:hypothetical protein EZV62_027585 [Acer yangbiense]